MLRSLTFKNKLRHPGKDVVSSALAAVIGPRRSKGRIGRGDRRGGNLRQEAPEIPFLDRLVQSIASNCVNAPLIPSPRSQALKTARCVYIILCVLMPPLYQCLVLKLHAFTRPGNVFLRTVASIRADRVRSSDKECCYCPLSLVKYARV